MYYQKYQLFLKKWRCLVSLKKYRDVIMDAILTQFPDAENLEIENDYFSFENPDKPTRGELSSMGRNISYTSALRNLVIQYDSKNVHHQPARKLFYCVEKNY